MVLFLRECPFINGWGKGSKSGGSTKIIGSREGVYEENHGQFLIDLDGSRDTTKIYC